jgi:hypothetical protein
VSQEPVEDSPIQADDDDLPDIEIPQAVTQVRALLCAAFLPFLPFLLSYICMYVRTYIHPYVRTYV